jgi:hypothetical protein
MPTQAPPVLETGEAALRRRHVVHLVVAGHRQGVLVHAVVGHETAQRYWTEFARLSIVVRLPPGDHTRCEVPPR